jgi:hypothetical protein
MIQIPQPGASQALVLHVTDQLSEALLQSRLQSACWRERCGNATGLTDLNEALGAGAAVL